MYKCEALQMLKMINKRCFNWPVNKQDMASQKIPHIFPIEYNIYTAKLATVLFL